MSQNRKCGTYTPEALLELLVLRHRAGYSRCMLKRRRRTPTHHTVEPILSQCWCERPSAFPPQSWHQCHPRTFPILRPVNVCLHDYNCMCIYIPTYMLRSDVAHLSQSWTEPTSHFDDDAIDEVRRRCCQKSRTDVQDSICPDKTPTYVSRLIASIIYCWHSLSSSESKMAEKTTGRSKGLEVLPMQWCSTWGKSRQLSVSCTCGSYCLPSIAPGISIQTWCSGKTAAFRLQPC